MRRRFLALACCLLPLVLIPAHAVAFSFSFNWGDIPRCTTGSPGWVPNPTFRLSSVPANTATIDFRMVDLDVPTYPHGGGSVAYTGTASITPGAFRYRSPCPPYGSHRYQWTATAKDGGGSVLGVATSVQNYP